MTSDEKSSTNDLLPDPSKNIFDITGSLRHGRLAGIFFRITANEGVYLGGDEKLEEALCLAVDKLTELGGAVRKNPDSPLALYRAFNNSLVVSTYKLPEYDDVVRVDIGYRGYRVP